MRPYSTVVWGLLAQNVIAACTIPIFLLMHLATSPTAAPKPSAAHLTVEIPSVITAPLSVIIGYWVPSVFQAFPAPSVIGFEAKQNYIALWQVFPINVSVLQYILPLMLSFFTKPHPKNTKSTTASLKALRPAYIAAYVFAAVGRVTMFTLIAANAWFPDLFAPEYRGTLSISEVMVAKSVSTTYRPRSIGLGILLLLHYDEMCCAAAWVVWSVFIYFQTDSGEKSFSGRAMLIGTGLGAWAVAGPAGAAVVSVWGRDELVLGGKEERVKKLQ